MSKQHSDVSRRYVNDMETDIGTPHRRYVNQQMERDPEFAAAYVAAHAEAQLALALADLRVRRGMSQRDLATATGIKQPMIARLERGGQTPTVTTLLKLLHALGASAPLNANGQINRHPTESEVA